VELNKKLLEKLQQALSIMNSLDVPEDLLQRQINRIKEIKEILQKGNQKYGIPLGGKKKYKTRKHRSRKHKKTRKH
jgi:hypothetical protein